MADLEQGLKEAQGSRLRLIVTDGVFSMDGSLAPLPDICALADKSRRHRHGRRQPCDRHSRPRRPRHAGALRRPGSHRHHHQHAGQDAGRSGGRLHLCAGRRSSIYLRQRSRPYLFSNALPPPIVMAALKALELIASSSDLRDRLHANAKRMRAGLEKAGFTIKPGEHPILPVMLGDAALATRMADKLLEHGIYVIGFSFPVVPQGQARIRMQMSAAHTPEQIDRAIAAFTEVGKELGVI